MIAEVSGTLALRLAGGVDGIITTGVVDAVGVRRVGDGVGVGRGVGAAELTVGSGVGVTDRVGPVGSGDEGAVAVTPGLAGGVASGVGEGGGGVVALGDAPGLAGVGVSATAGGVVASAMVASNASSREVRTVSRRSLSGLRASGRGGRVMGCGLSPCPG
ncbi:hypothetical protein GCM10022204_37150 [Microlunatus aurantiacus]|uniref:Uncharacterized protein n=2 Tax=Microlunatus aurantiacus TaxID=446786 RepID=A0ABP7E5D8_9ACTN